MKKRITPKDREAFALRVQAAIRQAGGRAESDDTGIYSMVISETKCGPLHLYVSDAVSIGLGFVAGRFLFPDRAVAILGSEAVNRHSGKWNHHYGTISVEEAVGDFGRSLKRVLGEAVSAQRVEQLTQTGGYTE